MHIRHALLACILSSLLAHQASAALKAPYRPLATIRRADDIWKAKRDRFDRKSTGSSGSLSTVKAPEAPPGTAPLPTPGPELAPQSAAPSTDSAAPSAESTAPLPAEKPADGVPGRAPTNFVALMQDNAALLIQKSLGTPYVGDRFAAELGTGFSPEGLPYWVLKELGFLIPSSAVDMARKAGTPVDPRQLEAGDLLFFRVESASTNRSKIFVGIYLSDGRFAYPSYTAKKVVLSKFFRPFWQTRFLLARRVISNLR